MTATIFHGPADPLLAAALAAAGFAAGGAAPAALLVNLGGDAGSGIAAAERFAADAAEGGESLVVNILHPHAREDWAGARDAAMLWAFTRHAALAWAPRGIRVNAVGLGVSPVLAGQPPEASGQAAGAAPAARATVADIAATIVAMWRFASMTGQLIRLGA